MAEQNPTRRPGRPSSYCEKLASAICARLAEGESLRSICRSPDMPSRPTVMAWLNKHPEFFDQYARARDIGYELLADEILDIADDGRNDWVERHDPENPGYRVNRENIARSRLRIDTRKWVLARMLPKKFGERAEAKVSSEVKLQVVTGIDRAPNEPRRNDRSIDD
ncbi:MAG: hypothetical protein RLN76_02150 [Phycisphaeraceae bacterium]